MLAGYAVVAIIVLLVLPSATPNPFPICDSDTGTYAANSPFQANLNLLAAALPANASATSAGFATATVGTAPNQVYALALCRGETNASSCSACLAAAFRDAQKNCPDNKGVTLYEDSCLLRFSAQRFLDFLKADQWQGLEIIGYVGQAKGSVIVPDALFRAAVTNILTAVVDHAMAAASNSTTKKYFATGVEDFDPKIYGLAQCVPVMASPQCQRCLGTLLTLVTTRFLGNNLRWVFAYSAWCNLMYSVRPFYEGRAMLQLTAPPAPAVVPPFVTPEAGAGKKRNATRIAAGVVCSVVLILILSVFAFVRFRRRIKARDSSFS